MEAPATLLICDLLCIYWKVSSIGEAWAIAACEVATKAPAALLICDILCANSGAQKC